MAPSIQESNNSYNFSKVTTLIFDIDDTLYDVGTGFTAHRNGEGATSFMVEKLNFPDMQTAKEVRDRYFAKYHSTAKALTVAEDEGQVPYPPRDVSNGEDAKKERVFHAENLSQWWAENLNFSLLGGCNEDVISMLEACPLKLVAFSNAPRLYALRVLRELGLDKVFTDDRVFAVDDVLPACKPEKEAFQKVMNAIGVKDPSECIMVEDSMKNIRSAKELGMSTVLITGIGRMKRKDKVNEHDESAKTLADEAEATKPGDAPDITDKAVDVCIESVAEMKSAVPMLWRL
mmetsp:Transcript_18791/g.23059  ORF Transcript_18791/g.23059 Transcript_18791/m.23059 type:complete len:289 (-) Transcript_18791:254-1120(-)